MIMIAPIESKQYDLATCEGRKALILTGRNAFLGRLAHVARNTPNELFLVTYGAVVDLVSPSRTWDTAEWVVDEWVDLRISVIKRAD